MTKIRTLLFLTVFMLVTTLAMPGPALAVIDQPVDDSQPNTPNRLLIGVEEGLSQDAVADQVAAAGLVLQRYWPRFAIAEAVPADANASSAMYVGAAGESFRHVSLDEPVFAANTDTPQIHPPKREPIPDDPLYIEQWAPATMEAVDAWNISHGDPGVVIGVIDSGLDMDHPDLAGARLWRNSAEANGKAGVDDDKNGYIDDINGWDWVYNNNKPEDEFGHGTHVSGIIAATTGNGIGVSGVGRKLRVAPLRMLDSSGSGTTGDLIAALDYAVDQEMDIVNLSLTASSDIAAVRDAIETATDAGVLIVAATGNYNTHVYWPAAYPQTVAVASTTEQDTRSTFSNYGPEVDIAAPGSDIMSLVNYGDYGVLSGTSMATPHVSALLGLLKSLRPDLSNQELVDLAQSTADDVNSSQYPGSDVYLGAGRVNFYQALLATSADLQLETSPSALDTVFVDDTIYIDVKVKSPLNSAGPNGEYVTDCSIAVAGAVVYAQVFANATNAGDPVPTAVSLQRKITNNNGVASFSIAAPDQIGAYTMRLQVGSALNTLSFFVGRVGLHVWTPQMTAGTESTQYRIQLFDENDQLVSGDVPMKVTTTIGTLEGGKSEFTALTHDGVYTGTLHGGTVSGGGTLRVGQKQKHITILPGPAAKILLNPVVGATYSDVETTYFTFEASVEDQYGNLVADGAVVDLTSSAGKLSTPSVTTAGGAAQFMLSVPRTDTDTALIDAQLQGEPVTGQTQVKGIPLDTWLPAIITQ